MSGTGYILNDGPDGRPMHDSPARGLGGARPGRVLRGGELHCGALRREARVGLYPIVTLEKQLPNVIGKLV